MNAQAVFNRQSKAVGDLTQEITKNPDGSARNLPPELAGAVLIAQSNVLVAVGLAWIAQALEGRSA